jgi:hypothetical protein
VQASQEVDSEAVPSVIEVARLTNQCLAFKHDPADTVPRNSGASPDTLSGTVALDVNVADRQEVRAAFSWQEAHHIPSEGEQQFLSIYVHDVTLPASDDSDSPRLKLVKGAVVADSCLEVPNPGLPIFRFKPQNIAFSERADARQCYLHWIWWLPW